MYSTVHPPSPAAQTLSRPLDTSLAMGLYTANSQHRVKAHRLPTFVAWRRGLS
ncbi:hypothetical protein TRAPUB_7116 [Trametes pubescens]|uniref:Uncharacterized protein n=1 Tax=Trametes pubescens TaxID=154538 RepID=A0A1M2V461_TRAPU|nr:hypothetical protein TRAPUB_7116 [Trametes pubescens]